MVPGAAPRGHAGVTVTLAAVTGCESGAFLRATDEDTVGELQPQGTHDSPQHRAGQETRGVLRIHRSPRTGSLAGADSQRPLRCADGPIHAQVAVPSPGPQSATNSAREVELLKLARLGSATSVAPGRPPGLRDPRLAKPVAKIHTRIRRLAYVWFLVCARRGGCGSVTHS